MNTILARWLSVGIIGYAVLPWYILEDGFWSFEWLFDGYPFDTDYAPGLIQAFSGEKPWLIPVVLFLVGALFALRFPKNNPKFAWILLSCGGGGFAYLLIQGFAIGIAGWEYTSLESLFGPIDRQFGLGYGAMFTIAAFLFLFTQGIAARGSINGDVFVVGAIGLVIAMVAAFVLFPVSQILVSALKDDAGHYALGLFGGKLFSGKIWGIGCLNGGVSCGAAWNSLVLSCSVGLGTTALGLAFALTATRSRFRAKKLLRVLTVLPIITPPFVIGLAIILLFGLSGVVTQFMDTALGIQPTRWIYGFWGIWLAQMLAFTPIAFLVLIGVVEGVSPSMEEAAQTLRADAWKTFSTVSLPLMRPGLANGLNRFRGIDWRGD